MKTKSRIWYVLLWQDELLVSEEPIGDESPGEVWKVRAITWKAAARKLIQGGTINEAIAKAYKEWDNPFQPHKEDSPAKDRSCPSVEEAVNRLVIRRVY